MGAKYADKIDPLRGLREDVARMLADHDEKCEKCRKDREAKASGGGQPSDQPVAT